MSFLLSLFIYIFLSLTKQKNVHKLVILVTRLASLISLNLHCIRIGCIFSFDHRPCYSLEKCPHGCRRFPLRRIAERTIPSSSLLRLTQVGQKDCCLRHLSEATKWLTIRGTGWKAS